MQCFVVMAQDLPLVGDIWARYEGRSRLAGSDESPQRHIGPPAGNILLYHKNLMTVLVRDK